jgi:hypothetical protein
VKREEETALKFLQRYYGTEPIHEPLGACTTPDFSIGTTAFEVRRLNQHYFHDDGSAEPLEELRFRLFRILDQELGRIESLSERGSFFWELGFNRPLSIEVRSIAKRLATMARQYYEAGYKESREIVVGHVTLGLRPSSKLLGKAFVWGAATDGDSGGFLGDIYYRNIPVALKEKITKTAKVAGHFERWVLVLIDPFYGDVVAPGDVARLDLKLEHFNAIAVVTSGGSLALEWPEGSLRIPKSTVEDDSSNSAR